MRYNESQSSLKYFQRIIQLMGYRNLEFYQKKQMLSPRGAYVTLLKSKRNPSVEKTRHTYLGQNNKLKANGNRNRNIGKQTKYRSNPKSDRQVIPFLNRQSTSKLESRTARRQSKLKSTMNSWSKACISLNTKVQSSHEEEMLKNQQGENCRLVVMNNGKAQKEHFLKVKELSEIHSLLFRSYPRLNHFLTVPRQIALQYLLKQKEIDGSFLNGQSLYVKLESEKYERNGKIQIQDFEIIKQIGSGGFSKVFIVRSKIDNKFYAMKLIEKQMVVKNKKKKIVMNERNIMVNSKHPFLVNLKYAFEAEKYIVFVMEYCAGGELFGLIKKYRRLSEDVSKFYIIEIFLGLTYLHQQNVVYRDIKPQNILLDIDGHVKIADLGLAKPDMANGQLAYSFCGSPQYMSPEMIMQVGHTFPVDYYCMGALLYELLTGLPPFYSQDPNEIYEAVLVQQIVFPEECHLSQQCKNLLRSLLCKDPKHRLGSLYGIKQILAHPWFGKQNYQQFLKKEITPPINFKRLDRIQLDTQNDKHRDSLQKVLKQQKNEKKNFKQIMKNFYHSWEPEYSEKRPTSGKKQSRRSIKSAQKRRLGTDRGKQNNDLKRMKKKMSGMLIRTPLEAFIHK